MLRLLSISLVMAVILTPVTGQAQPIRGSFLFEEHCAACHGNPDPGSRAPDREALRQFTPERVLDALTTGAMWPNGPRPVCWGRRAGMPR